MGHFHNPPPPGPIAGATAAQPYGRPKLTPPSVDNPPPVNEGRYENATPDIIGRAWQSDPWVYSLQAQDAGQPYAPGKLPSALINIPVNNPTPNSDALSALISVLQAWQPGDAPIQPQRYFPQGAAVVNNPPLNQDQATNLAEILAIWNQPGPPNPQQIRYVPQPAAAAAQVPFNNKWLSGVLAAWQPQTQFLPGIAGVPQGGTTPAVTQNPFSPAWLSAVLASWQPGDPPIQLRRQLNPTITAVRVDNPPFGIRGPLAYPLDAFVQPQQPNRFPQPAIVAAAQTPYLNEWLAIVLRAWQQGDPLPTLPRNLNPFFTAVRVDNPPGIVWRQNPYPADAFVLPQRSILLPQGAATVVAQNPFVRSWLTTVLQAWQAGDLPPTLPRLLSPGIPGQSVDNPPTLEGRLIISWLPPDYPQTFQRFLAQPAPPAVQQNPYVQSWLSTVLQSWQLGDPPIQVPRNLNPFFTGVRVDNPPFSYGGRNVWASEIANLAWQPPPPLPTLSGKLPPAVIAVRVDNPPFSSRSELANILGQWQFPPPQPTPSVGPPQVQPGPPPPPITAMFTVSGPDVSVYLVEFYSDVVYTDAPITKRTV